MLFLVAFHIFVFSQELGQHHMILDDLSKVLKLWRFKRFRSHDVFASAPEIPWPTAGTPDPKALSDSLPALETAQNLGK